MDKIESSDLHPDQLRIFQAMSSAKKLEIIDELRRFAWELKLAGLRQTNPQMSARDLEQRTAKSFLYARD